MYTTQWKAHYVHRCLRDEVMRKIKQMQGSFTLDSDNTLIISEAANVKGYWFRVRLGATVLNASYTPLLPRNSNPCSTVETPQRGLRLAS